MRQQGFQEVSDATCGLHFAGLNFQPRILAALVVLGIVLQSSTMFFVLCALLWWSALLPSLNPFEALYNRVYAIARGRPLLGRAPAPRRFAQGMAATMM